MEGFKIIASSGLVIYVRFNAVASIKIEDPVIWCNLVNGESYTFSTDPGYRFQVTQQVYDSVVSFLSGLNYQVVPVQ